MEKKKKVGVKAVREIFSGLVFDPEKDYRVIWDLADYNYLIMKAREELQRNPENPDYVIQLLTLAKLKKNG